MGSVDYLGQKQMIGESLARVCRRLRELQKITERSIELRISRWMALGNDNSQLCNGLLPENLLRKVAGESLVKTYCSDTQSRHPRGI